MAKRPPPELMFLLFSLLSALLTSDPFVLQPLLLLMELAKRYSKNMHFSLFLLRPARQSGSLGRVHNLSLSMAVNILSILV